MQHFQPFPPGEGPGLDAELFEIAHNVGLHPFQPGPGRADSVRVDAERDVLGTDDAVVALGNLSREHFHILAPDSVVLVVLRRDVDAVSVFGPGTVVDKGKLKRQGAVKIVEKRAVAVKDSGLIVRRRNRIVDVLVLDGFGVEALPHLADTVPEHFHIRDGLLCRLRPASFFLTAFYGNGRRAFLPVFADSSCVSSFPAPVNGA